MALFDELLPASFKGVQFFVDSSEKSAGRKTVIHEYPNKKFRYVEDLGQNLRTFTLNAVLSEPLYLEKRTLLEYVLDQGGIGTLIHPFYGVINAVCTNYNISEAPKSLGECIISMTFEEAFDNIFPVPNDDSASSISDLLDRLAGYFGAYFSSNFSVGYKKNTTDAADKLDSFNAVLNAPKSQLNTEDNAANIFADQSNDLATNKYDLIDKPSDLSTSILSIIDSYNDLGTDEINSFILNDNLSGFGSDDIYIDPTTEERIERIKNRKILNNTINGCALVNLYRNALLIPYKDNLQLLQISQDLEEKYQAIIYNDLSDDILNQIRDIRDKVRTFLDAIKVNISKVITINVKNIPLTVLLYQYYDNFDNEGEIISLNDIYDPSMLNGQINILTQG